VQEGTVYLPARWTTHTHTK